MRQLLPLGYTKSEIRQQLFLNSTNHGEAATATSRVGEREMELGKVKEKVEAVDSGKEDTGKKFTVGKIEVLL